MTQYRMSTQTTDYSGVMIYEIASRIDGLWNLKIYDEQVMSGVSFDEAIGYIRGHQSGREELR